MIKTLTIQIIILFILGGLGLHHANRNVEKMVARERWIKYRVYIGIVISVLFAGLLGRPVYFLLTLMLVLIGMMEILTNLWSSGNLVAGTVKSISLIAVYFSMSVFASLSCLKMSPESFIFVYILVAGFDGFSQVIGQMLGKTRLSPQISPNKTIEGFVGGLIVCVCLAVLLRGDAESGWLESTLLGVYIGGTALIIPGKPPAMLGRLPEFDNSGRM